MIMVNLKKIFMDHNPILKIKEREIFKFPIQELYDYNIEFKTFEEIETLRKAVMQFGGHTYKIDEVNPREV